jgi:hypothetical protein
VTLPLILTIPGVPRGKGRPRFVKASGRTYTPEQTASYEAVIRHEAALEMRGAEPVEGPLAIAVTAVLPIPASWSRKRREAAIGGRRVAYGAPGCRQLPEGGMRRAERHRLPRRQSTGPHGSSQVLRHVAAPVHHRDEGAACVIPTPSTPPTPPCCASAASPERYGGRRYERAKAAVKEYVANMLRENAA